MHNKYIERIYDNTNLAESYAGVVAPLTFSFARDLYEGVYRHFAVFMGISRRKRHEHEDIFPRMVVLIGYHMYYDLRNWYVLISLLPGYSYNKGFFEKMLGVGADNSGTLEGGNTGAHHIREMLRLALQFVVIAGIFISMPLLIRRFSRQFERAYRAFIDMDLAKMDYPALLSHYAHVRADLVRLWRIPIANDFAVMVSVGAAHRLYKSWTGRDDFVSRLRLTSNAHLATLDPGRALYAIAEELRRDPGVLERLRSEVPTDAYNTLLREYRGKKVCALIEKYIAYFGSRVPNELKLETPTLREAPHEIVTLILSVDTAHRALTTRLSSHRQHDALADINAGLFRRLVLRFLILWARRSIRYREETRLARTQIFGHARQVFLRIGDTLVEKGVLSDRTDVMYLTSAEMCDAEHVGAAKEVVEGRKREMRAWKKITMPSRIVSGDPISGIEERIRSGDFAYGTEKETSLRGIVASRGGSTTVSGKALVLTEFDPHADFADKILVTTHTDPGWAVAFSLVRGIVVERGGILSHASIVAREMNIPCIIGLSGATRTIPHDSDIALNMERGEVNVQNAL